jgi:galacturan 1,4-alpha-galacturonidase
LTIEDSKIYNQDDCIAINKGSNIVFQRNYCSGGHGISVGSVSSDATVKGIKVLDNQIVNNDQALRIKTKKDATNAAVSDITYSGNTGTGMRRFGIIIDQGYPTTLGPPGNGVSMSVSLKHYANVHHNLAGLCAIHLGHQIYWNKQQDLCH